MGPLNQSMTVRHTFISTAPVPPALVPTAPDQDYASLQMHVIELQHQFSYMPGSNDGMAFGSSNGLQLGSSSFGSPIVTYIPWIFVVMLLY